MQSVTRRSCMRWGCLCLTVLCGPGIQAGWWDPRFDLPGANGPIFSLVEFKRDVYAIGNFTRIARVSAQGIARWDGTSWMAIQPVLAPSLLKGVATEEAIYFVSRRAEAYQPTTLLRWDGVNWTDLGRPNGYLDLIPESLLAHGRDVYVDVSTNTHLNGPYAAAKWDGQAWSVLGTTGLEGWGSSHFAIAQENLYAAGTLYVPGVDWPLNLGRLVETDWAPVGGGVGDRGDQVGIASDGMNLFIAGTFRMVGSTTADGFAIWDGGQWIVPPAALRGGARVAVLSENAGEVLASEVLYTNMSDSRGLISQHVVQYQGSTRTVIARADAEGMQVMKRAHGGVYCAGDFRGAGGVPTGNIAFWNAVDWQRVGSGTFQGLPAPATCVAAGATNVYVGGLFEFAGDAAARHVAGWNGRGWHALGRGIDGTITRMATRGEELFVIGAFTSADGAAATNVARWNGSGWAALGGGLSGNLTAIAVTDQHVLVAQMLDTNFVIWRWQDPVWNQVVSATIKGDWPIGIRVILAMDDSIIVGGSFQMIDGITVNNLARWDGQQWHSFGSGLTGQGPFVPNDFPFSSVAALLRDGTNLYAGGSFTNAGGVAAKNVARWDGNLWSPVGEGLPGFAYCPGCIEPVTALCLVEGTLFAGGKFVSQSGAGPSYLAQWDGSNWSKVVDGNWFFDENQWNYYSYGMYVAGLACRGTDLYVVGTFATVGQLPSYGIGVWHASSAPVLQARLDAGRLVLAWPRQFDDGTIEFTESLSSTWRMLEIPGPHRSEIVPDFVEVEIVPPKSVGFYRLRWN